MLEANLTRYINLNRQQLLEKSWDFFLKAAPSNIAHIKIGLELEFYLLNSDCESSASRAQTKNFIERLNQKSSQNFLQISSPITANYDQFCDIFYKEEQGLGQIEAVFSHVSNLKNLCLSLDAEKQRISDLAQKLGLFACFAAQPFVEDCGSSLQFNISLHDENDQNLFLENDLLIRYYAIKLLDFTNEMMVFLAPNEADYLRFSKDLNQKLHKLGKHTAPVNLSFGLDNRSCAIRFAKSNSKNDFLPRLPPSFSFAQPKTEKSNRLEYRVAAAGADIWLSLACLLIALAANELPIESGAAANNKKDEWLENEVNSCKKYPQIFGNSFDEQYRLAPLCSSLEEAKNKFFNKDKSLTNQIRQFLLSF